MKNKTFKSFLILLISFFFLAVTAKAETVESTITYGETVDVSEKLGMSGQQVDSVVEVSKANGASGEEVLSYNCSGTTCTCQLKNVGLWHMSVHITVKYTNGTVKTLNLAIVDYWPVRAYLGNYNTDWSYSSSQWDSDNGNLTNSLTVTSKTRENVTLPTVGNAETTSASTGLPVKFVNFVRMEDVNQLTGEGSTMQVTMPVQKKGMCQHGGRVGDVAGAFGEPVAAGSTVKGTGPYIYVSCYEFREVVFLSLAGGEFKSGPTGSWTYNDKINEYMSTSSTSLPAVDDISFPWGLASSKRLVAWQNQSGTRKNPGETIELNGDTWTAIFEYDAMGSGTTTDRMVRVDDTTKISSSNTNVTSCTVGTKPSGDLDVKVENGICLVTGKEKTAEGDYITVDVTYSGGETVTYNFIVLASANFSEDVVFEPEIEVVGIQDEELGDSDIAFTSCGSWVCDDLITWGANDVIPGSTVFQSAYYAEGCNSGKQVGLCLDPGIYGPHGATYVRDTSMDEFMQSGAVKLVMGELATFLHDSTRKAQWNQGAAYGEIANYRNGVNTAFRIITMSQGYSYTYKSTTSEADCGGNVSCHENWMFRNAGEALKTGDINGALNYVYNNGPETDCTGSLLGQSPYCITKHYLEAYKGYSGTDDPLAIVSEDFDIEKKASYEQTGENSYVITFEGKITAPSTVTLTSLTASDIDVSGCSEFGYTCTFEILGGPDEEGKYDYKATATVADARPGHLTIPFTAEEKTKAAIRLDLSHSGASGITDAFVIKPQTGQRQRLVFFEEGAKTLSIYFSPAPPETADGICDGVTSATLAQCESELDGVEVTYAPSGGVENNPSLTCNLQLVKICCGMANEVDHPNLTHKVCSNSCSYNNVGAVCDFYEYGDSQVESSTLYHVREGYKYDDGTNYEKNLGECIVNVNDYAKAADKSEFNVVDAAGNLLNVEAYADNAYCQVTCREEWDLTMGTFGSYMGAEAVRAGESFQIADADIFIRGDRYCYTSYLDTNKDNSSFYANMQGFAKTLKEGFNAYSEAAHQLSDLSEEAPDQGANKGKTDNKDLKSIDNGSGSWSGGHYSGGSGSLEVCTNWYYVHYIEKVDDGGHPCGTLLNPRTCYSTLPRDQWNEWDEWECTETHQRSNSCSSSSGCGPAPTPENDKLVTFNYVNSIQLSGKYNDVDSDTNDGYFRKYKTTNGVTTEYDLTKYGNKQITVTCEVDENQTNDEGDYVYCSGSGSGITTGYTDESYKATDKTADELKRDMNDMIVGLSGNKAHEPGSSMNGYEGTIFKDYYDQLKEKLSDEMAAGQGTITASTYQLKAHAKMWYDCENFVLYTKDYTGVDIGTEDLANAKSEAGLDDNFKVLGDSGLIIEVGTVFNPKVAYSYDEVVYMNLIANDISNIHDNILERNDRKNSSILNSGYNEYSLPSANVKDFFDESDKSKNLGNDYDVKLVLRSGDTEDPNNKLSYSKKTNKVYKSSEVWTSETNTKPYEGTEGDLSNLKYGSGSDWKISVCYVGKDGTNYTEGDNTTYSPTAEADENGWKDGNCYTIGLPYYPNMNYIERGVANSSFYKNKGNWWANGSATAVHGDTLAQAIDNFNQLTSGGGISTDLSLYRTLGVKNVFPVSMTTPRNLYKYAYVFTNIGSFGGEKAGRLMGHENAVFKNNTRTCFYEVIETICRCCGDATVTNHTVEIPGVDSDVTETFGTEHSDQLGAIHSDPAKVTESTQGSIGFYNTVSSLANLSAVSDTGERSLAANWGEEAIFNYNGYNRYVTNKGFVAQKAIEAVGEDIYSPTYSAEYAYRLTPDAISEIKQDNMSNEYGISHDESHVHVYGKVLMVKSATGSYTELPEGEPLYNAISFEHYGSVFLEEVASKYAKPNSNDGTFTNLNLASRQDTNNTCEIKESTETSADGSTTASNLASKVQSGNCRWVDYIDDDGSASANYTASHPGCDPNEDYRCQSEFRLAFK